MYEKSADMMLKKYEKALSVRREFEELYDEIFEYCLPQRQGFKNYSAGQRRDDKIFDETAVVGIQEFASRLQSGLTPNFARWADFVTGSEVPEEERETFIDIVSKKYIERYSANSKGIINVQMVRLEVEAVKK